MAYLAVASNTQTVTVATEGLLVATPGNVFVGVPASSQMVVSGVVQCAAGTGGTAATVRVRQGSGTGGTLVGSAVVSPVAAAGIAAVVPFLVTDLAPPANGQYSVTVAFAGNTSSVVTSNVTVLNDTGILE